MVLDAADGVAVVVLRDPIGALRLAERALYAATAGLPLSVGINHGAVQLAGAGKGDEGLAGDGIAVAANVAEFAGPSALLVSRSFRDALADVQPGLEAQMLTAGTFTDAGLRHRGGASGLRLRPRWVPLGAKVPREAVTASDTRAGSPLLQKEERTWPSPTAPSAAAAS